MQLSAGPRSAAPLVGPCSSLPRGPAARPGALPARARNQQLQCNAANPLINLLASGICATVPAGIAVVTAKVLAASACTSACLQTRLQEAPWEVAR
jgi:hypothetical protein